MSVISLITDFGTRDGFTAEMKGVMLGINPGVRIVDITHDICLLYTSPSPRDS